MALSPTGLRAVQFRRSERGAMYSGSEHHCQEGRKMSVTYKLFTRWADAQKYTSIRQAVMALGLQPQAATYWKDGRNAEAHIIEKMASDLGENAAAYILAAAAEKVRAADEKRTLLRLARQFGYAAMLVIAASPALSAVDFSRIPTVGTMVIMSNNY